MIKVEDFRKLKLNITWILLYLAFFKKLISGDDIVEYAAWLLEQGDDSLDVCELAWTDGSDTYASEISLSERYEINRYQRPCGSKASFYLLKSTYF